MAGLSDKLNESKIKIEEYNRIKEENKNINNLKEYNRNIKVINNKIKEINLIVEALDDIVGNEISLEAQIKFKQPLKALLIQLENGKIDRLSNSYLKYISPIHENIGTIKNEYTNLWNAYYERKYSSSINLLTMLNTILDDVEIIKIKNDISKFSKKWPINTNDLKELDANGKKAYKKIEDLNLNNNIQVFLEKLLNNQIRLSDISKEVYSWLEANNLSNKIKLRV